MVAPRQGMSLFTSRGGMEFFDGPNWEGVIEAVDWPRVLIEAEGLHARTLRADRSHSRIIKGCPTETCGHCLRAVLLDRNWAAEGPAQPETYAPPPPPEPEWPSAEWYEQFEVESGDASTRIFIIPLDEHEPLDDPLMGAIVKRVCDAFGHNPLWWSGRQIPPVEEGQPERFELTLIDLSIEADYCVVHACSAVVCRGAGRACST